MNYANQAINQFNGYMLDAGRQQEAPASVPLIDEAFTSLTQAIGELDAQVAWLIDKVQPLCQESNVSSMASGAQQVNQSSPVAASPSRLRMQLADLRARIDAITGRISPLKYTIEV